MCDRPHRPEPPDLPAGAVRKWWTLSSLPDTHAMDAERINLIGTQLQDLNQRTLDLRGYL
jgi:hypothetical protein